MLILLVCTSHAALLKDIRVGEYEDYTRIVFELDAPAEPEKIELHPPRGLAVVFGNTSADLIRKIPVDRSPHVDAIKIFEKGARLTVLLEIDFKDFGHESFSLTDPPRLVLDIHPSEDAPPASVEPSPGVTPADESPSSQAVSTGASEPFPQPDEGVGEKSAPEISEPPPGHTLKPPVSAHQDPLPATPSTSAARPSGKRPGRLQFYLVIVLVIITIVILALLLLMLLARHRWIEEKPLSTERVEPENANDMTSTRPENDHCKDENAV